jgi:hypothetical protein
MDEHRMVEVNVLIKDIVQDLVVVIALKRNSP